MQTTNQMEKINQLCKFIAIYVVFIMKMQVVPDGS